MEGIAKNMFTQKSFFGDSKVDFLLFFEALGTRFSDFSALETSLEIECFLRSPWGSWMAPQNKDMTGVRGKNGGLDPD